jgi:hypothetical protein
VGRDSELENISSSLVIDVTKQTANASRKGTNICAGGIKSGSAAKKRML